MAWDLKSHSEYTLITLLSYVQCTGMYWYIQVVHRDLYNAKVTRSQTFDHQQTRVSLIFIIIIISF
jgi:hypothetical protein